MSLSTKTPKIGSDLHLHAARLYESQNNLEQAVAQYQQALAIAPEDPVVLVSMARLYDRHNDWSQAETLYVRASEADAGNATILNDLALCYARQKKFDQAVGTLTRAIEFEPNNSRYRNNIASVLVEAGNVEQALHHLSAVHQPPAANYNLGYMLSSKGTGEQAEFFFHRALELDPSFAAAREMLDSLRPAVRSADSNGQPVRRLPPVRG